MQLEAQLADRHVTIELTDQARLWLAEKGFDPAFGARPLARVIQSKIKQPLAEELLFGALEKGGAVTVHVKDDALVFEYQKDVPALAAPKTEKPTASKARSRGKAGGAGGGGKEKVTPRR
ncbi:MAG: ATP-dependent Clp protease ATP-binding subunit ClpA, partial [Alphaproteobacteria bacterium]